MRDQPSVGDATTGQVALACIRNQENVAKVSGSVSVSRICLELLYCNVEHVSQTNPAFPKLLLVIIIITVIETHLRR